MSLKSYLLALIKTRTSEAEAAHASMPADNYIGYGSASTYTAGADGYVMAYGVNATRLTVQNKNQELQTLLSSPTAAYLQAFTVCKKGDTINVSASSGGTFSSKIVRLAGGG